MRLADMRELVEHRLVNDYGWTYELFGPMSDVDLLKTLLDHTLIKGRDCGWKASRALFVDEEGNRI